MRNSNEISFEIVKRIGIIERRPSGWNKEVNLVSWNGGPAKYDIREWAPEHEKMGKGVTLTKEETEQLYKLLGEYLGNVSNIVST